MRLRRVDAHRDRLVGLRRDDDAAALLAGGLHADDLGVAAVDAALLLDLGCLLQGLGARTAALRRLGLLLGLGRSLGAALRGGLRRRRGLGLGLGDRLGLRLGRGVRRCLGNGLGLGLRRGLRAAPAASSTSTGATASSAVSVTGVSSMLGSSAIVVYAFLARARSC
jgi:hypothetical protein